MAFMCDGCGDDGMEAIISPEDGNEMVICSNATYNGAKSVL